MDSIGPFTSALEPVAQPSPRRGRPRQLAVRVATGLAFATVVAQLWLAQHLAPLHRWATAEVELRTLTGLALSPTWRYGLPGTTAAILLGLVVLGVRSAPAYAGICVTALASLALTYVWAMAALD